MNRDERRKEKRNDCSDEHFSDVFVLIILKYANQKIGHIKMGCAMNFL